MTEQTVILARDNQFGPTGPQAGDLGVSQGTYFIPNIDIVWHRVEFDDFPGDIYSCPQGALEFLT